MGIKLKGLQKAVRVIRDVAPELPVQQLQVLIEVSMDEGLTVRDVEKRCGMTNSSGSRNVRAIMKHAGEGRDGLGWVDWRPDHNDLRVKLLYLTDAGREVIRKLEAAI